MRSPLLTEHADLFLKGTLRTLLLILQLKLPGIALLGNIQHFPMPLECILYLVRYFKQNRPAVYLFLAELSELLQSQQSVVEYLLEVSVTGEDLVLKIVETTLLVMAVG